MFALQAKLQLLEVFRLAKATLDRRKIPSRQQDDALKQAETPNFQSYFVRVLRNVPVEHSQTSKKYQSFDLWPTGQREK